MPKKKSKAIEESTHRALKKEDRGRQPVVAVYPRAASSVEAAAIERAIDGLLTELVRQVRDPGRKQSK